MTDPKIIETLTNTLRWIEKLPVPTAGAAANAIRLDRVIKALTVSDSSSIAKDS